MKGLLLRALVLVMGFASSLSLIALVPAGKTPLTSLGARTITVYLAHGFIIKVLGFLPFFSQVRNQALALLLSATFTAAICLLFGNRFVAKCYQATLQKIGKLLLKDP